jgi:hypothetical protein
MDISESERILISDYSISLRNPPHYGYRSHGLGGIITTVEWGDYVGSDNAAFDLDQLYGSSSGESFRDHFLCVPVGE